MSWDRPGTIEDGIGGLPHHASQPLRPSLFRRAQTYLTRRSTNETPAQGASPDGPVSVVSAGADLQSTLSMSSQVLGAALEAVRDEHQRSAIQDSLAAPDLNKRITWMNKVLGSSYMETHVDEQREEDGAQASVMCMGLTC